MIIFTTDQKLWTRELMKRIISYDHSLSLKEFLNQLNFHMFIFAAHHEFWARELMSRIMTCDHSLGRNDIIKFIYCFMILFIIVYFLNFLLIELYSH
jgi:hypothetical protein